MTTGARKGSASSSTSASDRPLPEDPDEVRAELERTRSALKKANDEAKNRRLRLEELEAEEERRKEAQMSESERTRKAEADRERARKDAEEEARTLRSENRRLRIDREVERAALALNFQYPQDVPRLIDLDRIEIDEDTQQVNPKSVKDAVDKLAKDRPGLLTAQRGGGTPLREQGRQGLQQGGNPSRPSRQIDPYEQELIDMGRGGRM